MHERYDHTAVEAGARADWQAAHASDPAEHLAGRRTKPKYYCLCEPSPLSQPLVPHAVRRHALSDAIARFMHMRGYEVLQPIGWSALGLTNALTRHSSRVPQTLA